MNKTIMMAAAVFLASQLAHAQAAGGDAKAAKPAAAQKAASKEMTPQQTRMKSCNAEAAGKKLKGDTRKSFMKECLSGNRK